jgi:penicillin-binding protein 1C
MVIESRPLAPRRHRLIDLLAVVLGAGIGLVLFARFAPLPPPQAQLAPAGTVILGADGTILWRDGSAGIRIPVALETVSPAVIEATVAAEDQRFWNHPGVDPLAAARAAVRIPWERSGASTITQQLARRLYLEDQQLPLLIRKAREATLALQLDARASKEEILELYLNAAYYGRGAYGIEAAARLYFGVSAANLDLAQAAFLAGLPQRPWVGDADPAGEAARERQRYVLDRLAATGKITGAEADAAAARPLTLIDTAAPPIAVHFVQYAREELARLAPGPAGEAGLIIETTLDPSLEAAAERQALLQLSRLENKDVGNAAVVILDPRDGAVLAMAGNASASGLGAEYNMAITPRQPGSALKPFLYGLALREGFTAATPLLDIPSTFETRNGAYAPQNYDKQFRGIVTLRTALASSLNVPAVETLEALGVEPFLAELHRFGLTTLTESERYDLALALGAGEVRLLDLAAAYGVIANEGNYAAPFAITRVRSTSGEVLYERPPAPSRPVIDQDLAYILSDILSDPAARVPGFGHDSILELPFPAAVKTGTTTEFRDNWTIGFTANQVVAVWVGNADNRPMQGVSGISGAAPIWAELMKLARERQGPASFATPTGIERALVCAPTGLLPGPACPAAMEEWFLPGTVPASTEQFYALDERSNLVIDPPAPARPWLAAAGYRLGGETSGTPALAVVQPADGAVFFLAPELPEQELIVRLSCPPSATSWSASVDGIAIGTGAGCPGHLVTGLSAGSHHLEVLARLPGGRVIRTQTTYEVRPR